MTDFSKLSIDELKGHKFGGNITSADKDYFFNHNLVNKDETKARQVAVLLEKVMTAESKAGKNDFDSALLKDLNEEERKKSLAFQVLDSKLRGEGTIGYVTNAIFKLKQLMGGKGEETLLFEIDQEIESLQNALKDEKKELEGLKVISDKFDLIKKKIEEAQQKIGSNNILLKPKQEKLAELRTKRKDLEIKKNDAETALEVIKYENYRKLLTDKLQEIRSDAIINKGNNFPVNISRVNKGDVTATQLQNALFFLLDEVINKIDIDELETYLSRNDLKADYLEVKRGIEMLGTVTDADKYAKRNSDGDVLRESDGSIVFEKRQGSVRKMWQPDTFKIKEGYKEGKTEFKDVTGGKLANSKFPYDACLSLIEKIFRRDWINDGSKIKSLEDENDNPFKKLNLLKKQYKWVFAFIGNKHDKKIRESYGENTYEDSHKREEITWTDLQDFIKGFYEFFTPQNKERLITEEWNNAKWGFLSGGDVSNSTTDYYLPDELNDTDTTGKWNNKLLDNPRDLIDKKINENREECLRLEDEIDAIRKLRSETGISQELAKLDGIKKELETFKKGVIDKLLKKAREYYQSGGDDLKQLTRKKIWDIIAFLRFAKTLNKLESSDEDILDKVGKFRERIAAEAPAWESFWQTKSSFEEKIKTINATQARELKIQWEKVAALISFDKEEEEEYQKLLEVIKRLDAGENWEDITGSAPSSDLNEAKLGAIFGFTVSTDLLSDWMKIDGKEMSETKVREIIGIYKSDDTKLEAIASHIRERGVEGVADSKIAETDKVKLWEKFLKNNKASAVIKTIVVHENDDALKEESPDSEKKKAIIKEMREDPGAGYNATDPKKNTFKKERYGDPTEGKEDEVTREQLLSYLYDKKLENVQKGESWGKENKNNEGEKGFVNHLKENWHWYTLGIVVALALSAVIFWNSISEWWNGPAEEAGEGKVDEDEKKEEEE